MGNPIVTEHCDEDPGTGRVTVLQNTALQSTVPQNDVRPTAVWCISLIEALMLCTLLGLLAATLVPQLLTAQEDARQESLQETLDAVRTQIALYQKHHQGRLPAQNSESASEFMAQLCGRTEISGRVEANGRFGPYLLGVFPSNPCSQKSGVLVVTGSLQPHHWNGEGSHGWAYNSTTGEFRASLATDFRRLAGIDYRFVLN